MSMRTMDDLMDKICEELEDAAQKVKREGKISMSDLEKIGELIDIKKNILKVEKLEDEGGYSQAGDWEARGRFGYEDGNSYADHRRDGRGRYSRDGRDGRDYSMRGRRYSRDNGKESMMEHIDMMLEDAEGPEKEMIKRFKKQLQEL